MKIRYSVFPLFTNVVHSNNMVTITLWIMTRAKLIMVLPILVFMLVGCNFNSFSTVKEDESAGFNGSFEIANDGLPVNWYVYKPLLIQLRQNLFVTLSLHIMVNNL
jgi:formate/nitrite transporter FocA (FNT family)